MEDKVRIRYVGLVMFLIKVVGAFGGFAFIILAVRRLSQQELGVWTWISRITGYTLIPGLIISFWVFRFVARDWSSSKTGLILAGIFSVPVLSVYIVLVPMLAGVVHAETLPFLISAALIPLNYLVLILNQVALGTQAQRVGYGDLAFESTKLLVAYVLVFTLHFALVGAILSVEAGLVFQFIILVALSRKYLRGRFRKDLVKQWMSYSWLSAYVYQSTILVTFDAVIILALAGLQGTLALGYYAVAYPVAALVSYAVWLAVGLSPKLLKGGEATDIETALKLTMLFGIPMLVGILVIADPMVYLYGASYSIISTVTRILALSVFLDLIWAIADSVATMTVNIDRGKPDFKRLVKSRLFLLPSINLAMGISYLVALFLVLSYCLSAFALSVEQIFALWIVTMLIVKSIFGVFKLWVARRVVPFRIPYRAIAKYAAAAAVMAVVLMLCLPYVVYVEQIQQFVVYPLGLVGVGTASYLLVMLLIDKEFRQLVKAILRQRRSSTLAHETPKPR
jgi:hypothetical protein